MFSTVSISCSQEVSRVVKIVSRSYNGISCSKTVSRVVKTVSRGISRDKVGGISIYYFRCRNLKSVISRALNLVIRGISCSEDCNSWYLVLLCEASNSW